MSGALPLLLCVPLWRGPGNTCFDTVGFVVQAACFPGCYRHDVCVNEDSALMYFDVSQCDSSGLEGTCVTLVPGMLLCASCCVSGDWTTVTQVLI